MSKSSKLLYIIIVILVAAICVVAAYIILNKKSEHYAPTNECLSALSQYKEYQCSGQAPLTDKTKVDLLKKIYNKCPADTRLDKFGCDNNSTVLGGLHTESRHPTFFPAAKWEESIRGRNPTKWGQNQY
jgi:hypothetical protein